MSKALRKRIIKNTIIFILILLMSTNIVTFARYVSGIYGQSTARVALFGSNTSVEVTGIKGKPGDVNIIPIQITNEKDGNVSEVNQSFSIYISHDYGTNLPLEFTLYKDMQCTQLVYCDENNNYVDDEFVFKANQKQTKKYYLKVEWPEKSKDMSYAFEIDYLSINFRVIQVD